VAEPSTFYKTFSEKKLTTYGSARRGKIEQHRLGLLHRYLKPPGDLFEIGPGHGTLAEQAVDAGWRYTAIEASPILADVLRRKGLSVIESWTPPIPVPDASADVVYADQVLEHMSGIDAARQFTAEALRALRPGGIFFVVVPDYLKERTFFWDVDYTHNFVTTERRVKQLFNDTGFNILHVERSIGVATGFARDLLAAGALLVSIPGVDALSRYTRTEELLFKVRKNLFETLTFVARKPAEQDRGQSPVFTGEQEGQSPVSERERPGQSPE
jgi:SAM-dependent methyltransferase